MGLEEYMQSLIRIGFSREAVLDKSFAYAMEHWEVEEALSQLEEAAEACHIDQAAVEAEWRRQNEEAAYIHNRI